MTATTTDSTTRSFYESQQVSIRSKLVSFTIIWDNTKFNLPAHVPEHEIVKILRNSVHPHIVNKIYVFGGGRNFDDYVDFVTVVKDVNMAIVAGVLINNAKQGVLGVLYVGNEMEYGNMFTCIDELVWVHNKEMKVLPWFLGKFEMFDYGNTFGGWFSKSESTIETASTIGMNSIERSAEVSIPKTSESMKLNVESQVKVAESTTEPKESNFTTITAEFNNVESKVRVVESVIKIESEAKAVESLQSESKAKIVEPKVIAESTTKVASSDARTNVPCRTFSKKVDEKSSKVDDQTKDKNANVDEKNVKADVQKLENERKSLKSTEMTNGTTINGQATKNARTPIPGLIYYGTHGAFRIDKAVLDLIFIDLFRTVGNDQPMSRVSKVVCKYMRYLHHCDFYSEDEYINFLVEQKAITVNDGKVFFAEKLPHKSLAVYERFSKAFKEKRRIERLSLIWMLRKFNPAIQDVCGFKGDADAMLNRMIEAQLLIPRGKFIEPSDGFFISDISMERRFYILDWIMIDCIKYYGSVQESILIDHIQPFVERLNVETYYETRNITTDADGFVNGWDSDVTSAYDSLVQVLGHKHSRESLIMALEHSHVYSRCDEFIDDLIMFDILEEFEGTIHHGKGMTEEMKRIGVSGNFNNECDNEEIVDENNCIEENVNVMVKEFLQVKENDNSKSEKLNSDSYFISFSSDPLNQLSISLAVLDAAREIFDGNRRLWLEYFEQGLINCGYSAVELYDFMTKSGIIVNGKINIELISKDIRKLYDSVSSMFKKRHERAFQEYKLNMHRHENLMKRYGINNSVEFAQMLTKLLIVRRNGSYLVPGRGIKAKAVSPHREIKLAVFCAFFPSHLDKETKGLTFDELSKIVDVATIEKLEADAFIRRGPNGFYLPCNRLYRFFRKIGLFTVANLGNVLDLNLVASNESWGDIDDGFNEAFSQISQMFSRAHAATNQATLDKNLISTLLDLICVREEVLDAATKQGLISTRGPKLQFLGSIDEVKPRDYTHLLSSVGKKITIDHLQEVVDGQVIADGLIDGVIRLDGCNVYKVE